MKRLTEVHDMSSVVVVGTQWVTERKIMNFLSENAEVIAVIKGNNAGHTIKFDGSDLQATPHSVRYFL
ncbi:hypothetical protein ACEQPO_30155 [Bacillus sp. SL00103]